MEQRYALTLFHLKGRLGIQTLECLSCDNGPLFFRFHCPVFGLVKDAKRNYGKEKERKIKYIPKEKST
jgi:hypothetical protein